MNMTNIERIKNIGIKELAEILISYDDEYGYTCSDGLHFDGSGYGVTKQSKGYIEAVKHEIEWLQSEYDESERIGK